MSAEYKFTQVGFVTISIILLVAVLTWLIFGAAINSSDGQSGTILKATGLLVVGFFILVLAAFISFTIQLSEEKLGFWFGFGAARKSISLQDIHTVEVVKNPLDYHWGIKPIPGGWLYSIAPGGMAVELVMADGKLTRQGTNQPKELKQRVAAMIESAT
jgi:hypothetical protein